MGMYDCVYVLCGNGVRCWAAEWNLCDGRRGWMTGTGEEEWKARTR